MNESKRIFSLSLSLSTFFFVWSGFLDVFIGFYRSKCSGFEWVFVFLSSVM